MEDPEMDHSAQADSESISAQQSLFMRHFTTSFGWLYSLAFSMSGNQHDADDIMQEAGVLLWQNFGSFKTDGNFRNWAASFVVNISRNLIRKRRRNSHSVLNEELLGEIPKVYKACDELLELRREKLDECIAQLSAENRALLNAYYQQRDSIEQIARRLKASEKSIYARISRVRNALYRCISSRLKIDTEFPL